jgi:class 3 adenylate cyclase/TolB-like protein/Tfp pilus assembly protein PilF
MAAAKRLIPPPLQRAYRAVLLVDVVESVRLLEQDETDSISRWLRWVDHLKSDVLPASGGHLVKLLGDGMLIEFDDPRAAVNGAFAIQRAISRENLGRPPERHMLLRMGLEVGDVVLDHDDLYGRGVVMATRLATLAGPGEIVASAGAREQLTPALDADIEDLGECYLKHFRHPVRAFRIGAPGPRPLIEPGIPLGDLLPSVAVIPFESVGGADGERALGEVLAEELIRRLSLSPELSVISRLSTTVFYGRGSTLAEISANLNASYVLSGRCRLDEGAFILDAELADARPGRVVWSRRHRGKLSGLLRGRNELIDRLVADVSAAVEARELQRAQSQALPTLKSYTLLLGAIALMHRLSLSDFERARRMLDTLIDRASRQAIPQAWLAKWHVLRVQQGWSPDPEQDARMALRCTAQALDTDPDCSLALAIDGFVHTNLLKQLDVAEERYDRAIRTTPSEPLAWLLKGTLHAFRGEGTQAVKSTQRALRLSPLDPHRYFYDSLAATAHLAAHDFERALKLAERSLRANRTHTSTLRAMAIAQWRLGRHHEARATMQDLLALEPTLTVGRWRARSPAAGFEIGREWAEALREAGLPE